MIIISNIVDNTYTNSEGYKLFIALQKHFEEGVRVDVSFVNLTPTSTSFLNSSIGSIIETYGVDKFYELVRPVQITRSHADILRKYIDFFNKHAQN